jgi:hypothetical protein
MPLRDQLGAARRFLDRSLFPAPRPAGRAFGWGEKALLGSAFLALAIVLQLARIGWTASLNSLWAEDGPIFLQGALTHGFLDLLGTEYSGYLVFVPRLIAEAASLAPLRDAPAVVSILSAAAVGVSGLVVWVAAAGHIESPYLRGALALATVLTPIGGLETIDASAYVSWYMLFASFWLLLWRPRTQLGASLAAVFIVLAALSNPGIWFFAPLAALRALAIRDRRDLTIVVAYFGGAAVQALTAARSSYQAVAPVWTHDVWTVLLQRVIDGAALGLRLGGIGWEHLGWALLIVLSAAAAAGLALGLRRATPMARAFAAVAVPIALAMFVVSIYQRAVATPMLWPTGSWSGVAGRYSIVPVLLLISVAMILIEKRAKSRGAPARAQWAAAALSGLVLVSVAVSLPAGETATRGTPPWDTAVAAAAAECRAGRLAEVAIPISPPGFGMQLPCTSVPGGSDPTARR